MMWEYLAAAAIVLFAALQFGMAFLNWYAYPVVKKWKDSLTTTQSIPAKLALIIFF